MSVEGLKEVDGMLFTTAQDVPPPKDWTNDYNAMGGDEIWGSYGIVHETLRAIAIDTTDFKPLYAIEPYTGETMGMMETGSPSDFYLWNGIEGTIYQITAPDNLAEIVNCINEESGVSGLTLEERL